MSSSSGRLALAEGREVVYCHSCSHEWYRNGQGLACPRCQSDITEIVDPENDPRPPFAHSNRPRVRRHRAHYQDSDPEEEDIDEYLVRGPGGVLLPQRPSRHASRYRRVEVDPADDGAIFRRFTEMLMQDFGAPPGAPREIAYGDGGARTFHSTWTAGPVSATTTSFIISSAPGRGGHGPSGPDDFNAMWVDAMGGVRPPELGGARDADGPRPPGTGGLAGIQELLHALLNPAGAVHGDAVYSQEALDRIITALMEANPQSNAAPPASQAALDRLPQKRLDAAMLGCEGKVDCTICIEEVKKGDKVTLLPCKHWFHPDCVTLWLKQHNTCPICRTSIESGNNDNANNNNNNAGTSSSSRLAASSAMPPTSSSPGTNHADRHHTRHVRQNESRLQAIRDLAGVGDHSYSPRSTHSPGSNPHEPLRGYFSPYGNITTNHRRSSRSPPTERVLSAADSASRARARSPSQSRDRRSDRAGCNDAPDSRRTPGNNGSGGTMSSWLRNPFSRAPRDGSDNEQRRP